MNGISIIADEIWFSIHELWFIVDELWFVVNETRKRRLQSVRSMLSYCSLFTVISHNSLSHTVMTYSECEYVWSSCYVSFT